MKGVPSHRGEETGLKRAAKLEPAQGLNLVQLALKAKVPCKTEIPFSFCSERDRKRGEFPLSISLVIICLKTKSKPLDEVNNEILLPYSLSLQPVSAPSVIHVHFLTLLLLL